jgi:hypothetical protein
MSLKINLKISIQSNCLIKKNEKKNYINELNSQHIVALQRQVYTDRPVM